MLISNPVLVELALRRVNQKRKVERKSAEEVQGPELSSSSDHLKEIPELRFQDSYFLAHSVLPPIFVPYQYRLEIVRVKSKASPPSRRF